MFIFSFKTKGRFLIQHIVISGNFITLYTSKKDSIEIQPLITKLELSTNISGDHPKHRFLHNPFLSFSKVGDALPHKHLVFSKRDRLTNLREICHFMLGRQSNLELRQQDHKELLAAVDKERADRGDKEFPEYIKTSFETCDLTIPFLPSQEVELLLKQFQQYLESTHLPRYIERVSNQAEQFLDKNWNVIYGNIIGWSSEEKLSEMDRQIIDYYELLCDFRIVLLGINHDNSIKYNQLALGILSDLKKNPCYKDESQKMEFPFYAVVNQLECRIMANVNKKLIRFTALMVALINIGLQSYRNSDNNDLVKNSLVSVASGILTDVIFQPIYAKLNERQRLSVLNKDLREAKLFAPFKGFHNYAYDTLFCFLNSKEMQMVKRVNKRFNEQSNKIAAETKKQIFYMVGNPILVSAKRWIGNSDRFFNYRSHVPENELKASFPKNGNVKLFENIDKAIKHERSLMSGDPGEDNVHKPGVFKVQYLRKIKLQSLELDISEEPVEVSENKGEDRALRLRLLQNAPFSEYLAAIPIKDINPASLETDVQNVLPLAGILQIDIGDQRYSEIGYATYTNAIPQKVEKRPSFCSSLTSKCTIM